MYLILYTSYDCHVELDRAIIRDSLVSRDRSRSDEAGRGFITRRRLSAHYAPCRLWTLTLRSKCSMQRSLSEICVCLVTTNKPGNGGSASIPRRLILIKVPHSNTEMFIFAIMVLKCVEYEDPQL